MLEQPFYTEPILADAQGFIPGLFRGPGLSSESSAVGGAQPRNLSAIASFIAARLAGITVHLEGK